ncbi:hypothetical protein JW962_02480 [Candidatus Dojkabacteria bacterium]|nr:hypothetical protein [Candidatus Dojkabacteria bacterium]
MKRLTVNTLSAALYPAAFMIIGKIGGLYIANSIFGYTFSITNEIQKIFSLQITYQTAEQATKINNISTVTMLLVLLIGLSIQLIRAYFFHNTHPAPRTLVKLAELNFFEIIGDSYNIYVNLFVWLLYYWIAQVLVIVDFVTGRLSLYVLASGFVSAILCTWLAFRDVENEISEKTNFYKD